MVDAFFKKVLCLQKSPHFEKSRAKIPLVMGVPPINLKRLVMARQYQKVFNCLNDDLSHDGSEDAIASYFLLEQFYEEYFPDQTPMEKFNYYPHDLYADLI